MPHRNNSSQKSAASAIVISLVDRLAAAPAPDPEPPDQRLLRMLAELGPERIIAAVKLMEQIKNACPTARREAEDMGLME